MEPGIVRADERDGLQLDLVVEPHEGFGVVPDSARVVGDPGSVLVLNDAQLERVGLVRADVFGGSACVHWLAMRGASCSGFWMAVASRTSIIRQLARDSV